MDVMTREAEILETDVERIATKLNSKVVMSLDDVNWEEAGEALKWAILVKLSSGKFIRKAMTVDVFRKLWKLNQEPTYFKVEKNLLLIKFSNMEDQEKVLSGGPWMLEGEAVLMQKWELGMTGDDFESRKINIWIHLHG